MQASAQYSRWQGNSKQRELSSSWKGFGLHLKTEKKTPKLCFQTKIRIHHRRITSILKERNKERNKSIKSKRKDQKIKVHRKYQSVRVVSFVETLFQLLIGVPAGFFFFCFFILFFVTVYLYY